MKRDFEKLVDRMVENAREGITFERKLSELVPANALHSGSARFSQSAIDSLTNVEKKVEFAVRKAG